MKELIQKYEQKMRTVRLSTSFHNTTIDTPTTTTTHKSHTKTTPTIFKRTRERPRKA